jgi:hypothetical protein
LILPMKTRRRVTEMAPLDHVLISVWLTYEQGLSVRVISERLQISKTSVPLLRAREAGLIWPLPPIYADEAALQRALFRRVGRPRRTWANRTQLAPTTISVRPLNGVVTTELFDLNHDEAID